MLLELFPNSLEGLSVQASGAGFRAGCSSQCLAEVTLGHTRVAFCLLCLSFAFSKHFLCVPLWADAQNTILALLKLWETLMNINLPLKFS